MHCSYTRPADGTVRDSGTWELPSAFLPPETPSEKSRGSGLHHRAALALLHDDGEIDSGKEGDPGR